MGSPLSVIIWIKVVLLFMWASARRTSAQKNEAANAFDHAVGRYAFASYNQHNKTGFLYSVRLPANLSDLGADIVRFRCGSLRRYGAQVKEFSLAVGVTVQPCVERVLLVRQDFGDHWSPMYYDSFNVTGYILVSRILGLAAYDARNLSEAGLFAGKAPIRIDFSNAVKKKSVSNLIYSCASFGSDGRIGISPQVSPNTCVSTRDGHFGLVTESLFSQPMQSTRASKWKIIVGSTLGGALGAFLLGLLLQALVVKVKKKSERVEMERMAYEEEALHISMVGHVRAPTASGVRTQPRLEHEYVPPIFSR